MDDFEISIPNQSSFFFFLMQRSLTGSTEVKVFTNFQNIIWYPFLKSNIYINASSLHILLAHPTQIVALAYSLLYLQEFPQLDLETPAWSCG